MLKKQLANAKKQQAQRQQTYKFIGARDKEKPRPKQKEDLASASQNSQAHSSQFIPDVHSITNLATLADAVQREIEAMQSQYAVSDTGPASSGQKKAHSQSLNAFQKSHQKQLKATKQKSEKPVRSLLQAEVSPTIAKYNREKADRESLTSTDLKGLIRHYEDRQVLAQDLFLEQQDHQHQFNPKQARSQHKLNKRLSQPRFQRQYDFEHPALMKEQERSRSRSRNKSHQQIKTEQHKLIGRLSQPKMHIEIARDLPFNNYTLRNTFQGTLRNDSGSPERSPVRRATEEGWYNALAKSPSVLKVDGRKPQRRTTVEMMRQFLGNKYLQLVVDRAEQQTAECTFEPDLKLTTSYNKKSDNKTWRKMDPFTRERKWADTIEQRNKQQKQIKEIVASKELKFKPKIKQMVIAPALSTDTMQRKYSRSPNIIPLDTDENRQTFKNVPGMAKYLQRQFVAMIDREEMKLLDHNMGLSTALKKSFQEVIKDQYAYTRVKKNKDGSVNVTMAEMPKTRSQTPTMAMSRANIKDKLVDSNYDTTSQKIEGRLQRLDPRLRHRPRKLNNSYKFDVISNASSPGKGTSQSMQQGFAPNSYAPRVQDMSMQLPERNSVPLVIADNIHINRSSPQKEAPLGDLTNSPSAQMQQLGGISPFAAQQAPTKLSNNFRPKNTQSLGKAPITTHRQFLKDKELLRTALFNLDDEE